MTVTWSTDGGIELRASCQSSEAEHLLTLLLDHPEAEIDLRACEFAHAAVVQVLLAAHRPVRGPAGNDVLRQWVEPLLPSR